MDPAYENLRDTVYWCFTSGDGGALPLPPGTGHVRRVKKTRRFYDRKTDSFIVPVIVAVVPRRACRSNKRPGQCAAGRFEILTGHRIYNNNIRV